MNHNTGGDGTVVMPLAGLYNSAEGIRDRWRVWRRLGRCAALTDAAAEGSQVWATGTVQSFTETLVAPLSGQTCVAYRVRAWPQGAQSGRRRHARGHAAPSLRAGSR